MVDITVTNEHILRPILESKVLLDDIDCIEYLSTGVILSGTLKRSTSIDDLVDAIVSGDTILFVEGINEFIIIYTSAWKARAIEEPNSEKGLRGPKEGFTESITTNLTLIRRKIRTKDLKFQYIIVGERSRTKVCICYIDGLVHEHILDNIIDKIKDIYIDAIVDVKYIEEFIDDNPFSLFETYSISEKPDIVSGKILEGRVAVLVDGSPSVMTAPTLFIESFMAGDDYYVNYYYASLGRLLRAFGFIATISIPALYLSLVAFHQGTIPTPLLITIYASRVGVPFPSFVELMILLTIFEILREAITRVPGTVAQAVSIVGVLVLGTAAVDARLVSAPMIIMVGVSSITGLMLPNFTGTLSIIRLGLLLLSSVLGIYGYIFGMLAIIIHLFTLRSYGVPFMGNLTSFRMQSIKDTVIRAPAWYMRYRPKFMSKDAKRGSIGGKGDE
jgi:spore germination protein KA